MTRRMKQALLGVAALAVLAFGGAGLAQAQTSTAQTTLEPTSGPDRDTIQSGDQTTPDAPAKASSAKTSPVAAKSTTSEAPGAETAPNSDGPSGPAQEAKGTSSAPADTPGSQAPETGSSSETPTASDGPGGHADEPGNANADHQANGVE